MFQVAYAIGVAHPLAMNVDTYGTGKKSDSEILAIIKKNFDLRPGCIVRDLGMRAPIFRATAKYGHFGRDGFAWEVPKTLEM